MKKQNKFLVHATMLVDANITIEADSAQQAINIAKNKKNLSNWNKGQFLELAESYGMGTALIEEGGDVFKPVNYVWKSPKGYFTQTIETTIFTDGTERNCGILQDLAGTSELDEMLKAGEVIYVYREFMFTFSPVQGKYYIEMFNQAEEFNSLEGICQYIKEEQEGAEGAEEGDLTPFGDFGPKG